MAEQVKPQVFKIAQTVTDFNKVHEALQAIGMNEESADEYHNNRLGENGADILTEFMGRLCYKSFEVGLNSNVTKIREGMDNYIGGILKSKHGSVLEHSSVSFAFIGVTRVFTHEIVRHRAGTAFSQESLRYVRLDNLSYRMPSIFKDKDFLCKWYNSQDDNYQNKLTFEDFCTSVEVTAEDMLCSSFSSAEDHIAKATKYFNLDSVKSFDVKKIITSALRRCAPIGLATNIGVTANHRAWRYMIEKRTEISAEEEIREVFAEVALIMKTDFPNIYQDMTQDHEGQWLFENSRI